MTDRRIIMNRY